MTKRSTGSPPSKERNKWQSDFLAALERYGDLGSAFGAVDINKATAYGFRNRDKNFAEDWDEALKRGIANRKVIPFGVDLNADPSRSLESIYNRSEGASDTSILSTMLRGDRVELTILIDAILLQRERRTPAHMLISEAIQHIYAGLVDAEDAPDLDTARAAIKHAINEMEKLIW